MPEINLADFSSIPKEGEMKALLEEIRNLLIEIRNLQGSSENLQMQTGDMIFPIYLGTTLIDEVVLTAQKREDLRSGGR